VRIKPLAAIRDAYADLLGPDDDEALVGLLRDLDAGYKAIEPPALLRQAIRTGLVSPSVAPPVRSRVHRKPLTRALILPAGALILIASVAIAAGAFINLGKPTNAVPTNPYFPLGDFHPVKAKLAAPFSHEVLFIGDAGTENAAAEEWPLVKALQQFGTLANVQPYNAPCHRIQPPPGEIVTAQPVCGISTFDLTHARLRGAPVSFAYRTIEDTQGHCTVNSMSAAEWAIFVRYGHSSIRDRAKFCAALEGRRPAGTLSFPLLLIGGYVQAGIQTVKPGDFEQELLPPVTPTANSTNAMTLLSGLPFDAVQSALAGGKDPRYTSLVEDVNAEANTITAFICRADGGKPAKVCNRSVIKHLRKHIK
jgi:hypothetical protein